MDVNRCYNESMNHLYSIFASCILIGILISTLAAQEESPDPPKKIRKVKRVAKPTFEGSQDDIYFKDVFKDGLVGERPDESAAAQMATTGTAAANDEVAEAATGWSSLIDGTTIEDDIKSLNQELARAVTTTVKFKTT